MAAGRTTARQVRYRLAFFITALIVLALVVTLPFSVKSVVDDILGPATGRVMSITRGEAGPPEAGLSDRLGNRGRNYTKLHLAVTAIDEVQLLATIRVGPPALCGLRLAAPGAPGGHLRRRFPCRGPAAVRGHRPSGGRRPHLADGPAAAARSPHPLPLRPLPHGPRRGLPAPLPERRAGDRVQD